RRSVLLHQPGRRQNGVRELVAGLPASGQAPARPPQGARDCRQGQTEGSNRMSDETKASISKRCRPRQGGGEEVGNKPYGITIRLTEDQHARLEQAAHTMPYRITATEIITRGIELAARELESMA